jgi:hypothetical protein
MNDLPLRERAGPFLILGIDKDADAATIAAQFERQRHAVQAGLCHWTLDDLDWARNELQDAKQRLAADLNSLDVDLASGEIHRLARLYSLADGRPGWEPLDPEPKVELMPPAAVSVERLVADVPQPDVPLEIPAINRWLDQFAHQVADPWTTELEG